MRTSLSRPLCRSLWAATFSCAVLHGAEARAQEPEPPRDFCWVGRPASSCRAFLVAEVHVFTALEGSRYTRRGFRGEITRSKDLTGYAAWEVGRMVNRGPDHAIGGSLLVGGDANGQRVALKGRYRRWLDRGSAVDVGAGLLHAGRSVPRPSGEEGNDHEFGLGATGDVSVGLTDWAALGVQGDLLFTDSGPAAAIYGGMRLGTRPGLVGTAAPLIIGLLVFALAGGGSP